MALKHGHEFVKYYEDESQQVLAGTSGYMYYLTFCKVYDSAFLWLCVAVEMFMAGSELNESATN